MIVVLKPKRTKKEEAAVLKEIRKLGYKPHVMRGVARTVIGAIGDERTMRQDPAFALRLLADIPARVSLPGQ